MRDGKVMVVIPKKYKEHVDEELELVKTVYREIGGVLFVSKPNPRSYLPPTKLEELAKSPPETLAIMDYVRPSQVYNILKAVRTNVVDRVMLILEIFAQHAGSKEALLQIELAKIKHELPLIRDFVRRAKIGEMAGFLGPGKYGYEKYYAHLRRREAQIRRRLDEIREVRKIRREKRLAEGLPHVAIAGYTCAGKTTLFNALTGESKPVGPEPFTTLSPKTSSTTINGKKVLLTDTVGFIRDLPPEILEAFYATLEEISTADAILLVLDSSKPLKRLEVELKTSKEILKNIGAEGKPKIFVLNKIDLIGNPSPLVEALRPLVEDGSPIVPVSSTKRINLDALRDAIAKLV